MGVDTLVAQATAPVPAGVAVVRLSGPLAHAIARQISGKNELPHASMRFATLRDGQSDVIDRGYIVAFFAPASFTGEDIAEFHVHGSIAVSQKLVEVCCGLGARPALAGEFSLRAFEHGKLDLVQAEALLDLISARSDDARKSALSQLDGNLSRLLLQLRQPLLHVLAEIEARLDFATEADVGLLDRATLLTQLQAAQQEIESLTATMRAGRLRLQGARVVLYGAPNAGKSTLLNALAGADRALVDARPGTTRDTIEVTTAPQGVQITWIDTAGMRLAGDHVEQLGTERTRREVEHADVVLWLDDGAAVTDIEPPQLINPDAIVLAVHSKIDVKMGQPQFDLLFVPSMALSVADNSGVPELLDAVVLAVRSLGQQGGRGDGVAIARQRHAAALADAGAAIARARAALRDDMPLEFAAADLRDALLALAELVGDVRADDVLGVIFGQFCIGK